MVVFFVLLERPLKKMRALILIALLVIAGLSFPAFVIGGYVDLAISDPEPGGYSFFEQVDFEEELNFSGVGGWMTGSGASKAEWHPIHRHSHSLPSIPPPPKSA